MSVLPRRLLQQLVIIGLLAAAPALAQRAAERQQNPGGALLGRIRATVAELRLTDAQQRQIDQILEDAAREFREIGPRLLESDPAERRQQVERFIDGVAAKIRPVLTEEQAAVLDQRMQQMRAARGVAGTQGASDPAAFGPQRDRPGPMLERLRQSLDGIGLSDEQQAEIDQIVAEARQRVQQARRQSEGDPQVLREKLSPILAETRERIVALLTAEQREKFRETMPAPPAATPPPRMESPATTEPKMSEPAMAPAAPEPSPPASPPDVAGAFDDSFAPLVGQPAPTILLKKVDGTSFSLASLRGRIVLIVFGSYSSPSFRQRAVALERIKRDYGNRISPIVVYTRENHPAEQWEVERNKDEGVSMQQPADLDARIEAAKRARDALKLSLPIAVDSMDDATATAYGGTTNAAVLIGRDGTILARQRWFEPYAMRRAIDEALKAPATQPR